MDHKLRIVRSESENDRGNRTDRRRRETFTGSSHLLLRGTSTYWLTVVDEKAAFSFSLALLLLLLHLLCEHFHRHEEPEFPSRPALDNSERKKVGFAADPSYSVNRLHYYSLRKRPITLGLEPCFPPRGKLDARARYQRAGKTRSLEQVHACVTRNHVNLIYLAPDRVQRSRGLLYSLVVLLFSRSLVSPANFRAPVASAAAWIAISFFINNEFRAVACAISSCGGGTRGDGDFLPVRARLSIFSRLHGEPRRCLQLSADVCRIQSKVRKSKFFFSSSSFQNPAQIERLIFARSHGLPGIAPRNGRRWQRDGDGMENRRMT